MKKPTKGLRKKRTYFFSNPKTFFICLVFGVAVLATAALAKTVIAEFKILDYEKKFMNLNYQGRYVASASGVVKDTKSGLEWLAGPDRDTSWAEARSWAKNLSAGGGWRMPTDQEMKTLFIGKEGSRNLTPLLKTTGWWIWVKGTQNEYDALLYCLGSDTAYYADRDISLHRRGFAVRSAK